MIQNETLRTPEEILRFAYEFRRDEEHGYLLTYDDIIRSLVLTGITYKEAYDYFTENYGKEIHND